jgi:hypothetical protein
MQQKCTSLQLELQLLQYTSSVTATTDIFSLLSVETSMANLHFYSKYVKISFNPIQDLEFIELYSPLAQPLQVSFYLLTTITTLSVYDRYPQLSFYMSQHLQVSFYLLTTLPCL